MSETFLPRADYGKQVRTACGSGWLNVIIWKFILEKQVTKLQPSATADGSDPYIDSEFAISLLKLNILIYPS
jgi:hypothetical protein